MVYYNNITICNRHIGKIGILTRAAPVLMDFSGITPVRIENIDRLRHMIHDIKLSVHDFQSIDIGY